MNFRAFSLIALLSIVSACDSGTTLFDVSGHYEGTLTNHLDGKSYTQTLVSTDIASGGQTLPELVLKDKTGATQLTLQIAASGTKTIFVRSTPGLEGSVALNQGEDPQCFSNPTATLCASGPELSFDLRSPKDGSSVLSLVLYRVKSSDLPPPEVPRAFTLSQAIDRARTMSFASRIEFEHVIQAKARAKAAYLHLLPQLTLGTVANNMNFAPLAYVGTFSTLLMGIGDLAPFLLPNRWIQASEAAHQSKAEEDTATLMRLDMGAQVEALYYAYDRDRKTRDLTKDIVDRTVKIRDEVKIREDLGQLPLGSTANLNSILNQLEQGLTVLDQVKAEDLATLSQTLGFYSPTTVTNATIDSEAAPIETAKPLDYATTNAAALSRAYELDQMDELIAGARDARKSELFSWLDPAGDPSLGLGLALPAEIQVASSQIRELELDRQELESIVSQKVYDAVTDYSAALDSYKQATDGMAIQQRRLDTALENLQAGVKIDFFGLIGILQDYLTGEIAVESARANYRVARSKTDRLLLEGYYARF